MNIVRAKSAWYGWFVTTRTAIRCFGIGAGERVDDVEVAAAEVLDGLLAQPVEVRLRDLGVDVPPPDPVLGAGLADDELVLRRAAGVLAGVHVERAALGNPPLAALDGVVVE